MIDKKRINNIGTKLTDDENKAFNVYCTAHDRSRSWVIQEAVKQYINFKNERK